MRDIHPVTWMFIIFIIPMAIAIIGYIIMQIYAPGGDRYSLYSDFSGTTVLAWYVYRLPQGSEETSEMMEAHNISGALFWSLSMVEPEAGWEGKIELIRDRYLAFSRGGLYHSLFNTVENRPLVHIAEPHEDYAQWAEKKGLGSPYPTNESYREWVEEMLHRPIVEILEGETDPPPTPRRA
jgi:hypothetical protein